MSERINQVSELFSLVETKLNKGGSLAFKMASARLIQLANELDSMFESESGEEINILPPSTKKKQKKRRKEDTGNNSALNHTKKRKTATPGHWAMRTPHGPAATQANNVSSPTLPPLATGEGENLDCKFPYAPC
jgi:hypothetical protein